jgi:hypothetical protein
MMHIPQPVISIVVRKPVAMLEPKPRPNRRARRDQKFGRQHVFDEIAGRISPKQMREWEH